MRGGESERGMPAHKDRVTDADTTPNIHREKGGQARKGLANYRVRLIDNTVALTLTVSQRRLRLEKSLQVGWKRQYAS